MTVDLNNLKTGYEVYFVDKSEGPGVAIYIHGTVVDVGEETATVEIINSGTLVAPGYSAPYEPSYSSGGLISLSEREGEFLSPKEFSVLKEEYQIVPSEDELPNQPSDDVEDSDDDEDALYPAPEDERQVSQEEVEEGAPEFETEGLYLVASLKSWSVTVGIEWPKGFPQDWMEKVYADLPEGVAEKTPGGEPVVVIPGTKGPGIPPGLREGDELEKQFNEHSQAIQEAAKGLDGVRDALADAEQQLQTAKESGEGDASSLEGRVRELEEERKIAVKRLETAKDKFIDVKRKLSEVWKRAPDEGSYEPIHGGRAPRDVSYGRAGLRLELKQLSDNYKKTKGLIESVEEQERKLRTRQREIDLLLSLRKKKLTDLNEGEDTPRYQLEDVETPRHPAKQALTLLKKLKYRELKQKPYLWTPEERDRLVEAAGTSAPEFASQVGGPRSFFDLPSEEVDVLIRQEVEKNGPMSEEEVKKRAFQYALDFKDYVKKNIGWKDISKEIQKYLRDKLNLNVSQERADIIADEMYKSKNVTAKGENLSTGEFEEVRIPVQQLFDDVVHPIVANYEKRIKWFQFLQNGRKHGLAQQKAALRRMLVDEEPAEEDEKKQKISLIDEERYKDAIVSVFQKYATYSHEKGTSDKIPSRYRIHHGLPAFEEKGKELAKKRVEEMDLLRQQRALEEKLRESYVQYKRASDALQIYQEDVGRIQNPSQAEREAVRILEESEQISSRISQLVEEREFLQRFHSGEDASPERVKEIKKEIQELEEARTRLFSSPLSSRAQAKLLEYDKRLKKALEVYQETSDVVEKQLEQIYNRLDKVRSEKDKIVEEIGVKEK